MLNTYIQNINRLFQTGSAREHSYRGDLQELLKKIIDDENIIVTNEPARIVGVGAPDFSITKNKIPIGYIEAKDIDKDLDLKEFKEQFNRYKEALDNLIITNYIDFEFYKNGELTSKISIARIENNQIIPIEENFEEFVNLIKDFISYVSQTIKSPLKLAKLMAAKARLLRDVIEKALLSDEESSLKNELKVFQTTLIHDITPQSFADIYAQTIAYGLFTARLHDYTLQDFSRQEAQYLIPKSNPFLRGLFNYIGGADCDDRLIWIIDSLAEVFLATNIREIFENYGKKSGMSDPVLHFYETFLAEYDPKLKKARGVWYTPTPVVDFIVKSVDEVLKQEFDLEDGLIDDTKITIKVDDIDAGYTKSGKLRQKEKEVHKVQILDPATGTGTFLARTIEYIKQNFWGGSWSAYVQNDLIPRLNGFELLMASYAMAHLKLDMMLLESGYKPVDNQRLNIYLTNSLESYHENLGNLFSSYLANESKQADRIKKETPVMVVMGNPPYSGVSSNNIDWINKLIDDYKYIDGVYFNERKHWLNDDYVKFIRYAQYMIDKTGYGMIAFINPHGFLDNTTFRGMRYSLLKSFDKIYTLDLHGNSNKKETCPDGSKDENVFDIKQGVSINIFIKTTKSKKEAQVYHYDLYGKRDFKYNFLDNNSLNSIKWSKLEPNKPNCFFVPKNENSIGEYSSGFDLSKLFEQNVTGIVTMGDNFLIAETKEILKNRILDFLQNDYSEEQLKAKYNLGKNYAKWIIENKDKIIFDENKIVKISYRPFDTRYTYFDNLLMWRWREKIMKHFINLNNLGLIFSRQSTNEYWNNIQISKNMIDNRYHFSAKGTALEAPLYLYNDENSLTSKKELNLNQEIIKEFEKSLNLEFISTIQNSTLKTQNSFNELDVFDYIYAVLHSPKYREKYKEFLKIDFPRVPYPKKENFFTLVEFGRKLRAIHLLEDKSLDERTIEIIGEGQMKITNKLNKKDTIIKDDKVEIKLNDDLSIANIPLTAWEFYIGGYQPAQKWLKDRVGRELSRNDIKHYNRIINALLKTDAIMNEIDEINIA